MSRYIDADELKNMLDKGGSVKLDDIPTADVEPVVKCDNCIYKDSCCRNMFTSFNDYPVDLEWCSAGEIDGEKDE